MKIHNPLWAEGTFLLPQHFQQQAFADAARLQAVASLGVSHAWGVKSLAWDVAALEIGRVKLQSLSLRLPDGTLLDCGEQEPLPSARETSGIPAAASSIDIHVGVPLWEPQGSNCEREGAPEGRARRLRVEHVAVPDLLGDGAAEMPVARLNVRLMFGFEPRADFVSCQIGRLIRNGRGGFDIDAAWIPPGLTLASHEAMPALVERLLGVLLARSAQLGARRGERNQNLADYSVSDVSVFWLLNCINTAWPEFLHLKHHPGLHPERLWAALARLAGSLAAFSLGPVLERIPPYDHEKLQTVFGELEALIRELIDTVIPSQVIPIALERIRPSLWRAQLNDERLLERADFFLAVRAAMPGLRLQEQLPAVCKIGAPEEVERILNSAVVGIPVSPLSRVPSAIPMRLESQYFVLEERSPAFARMLHARSCSVYVPASIPEVALELFAVLRT
ncbi:MAG: type VI secretion system baseplate subunit TssK [Candidatus Dactylopiibacterium sp.]|nr:type VI secretion system baseplate subunit TssK [Candidatus Dactylopiibacterium sp.]